MLKCPQMPMVNMLLVCSFTMFGQSLITPADIKKWYDESVKANAESVKANAALKSEVNEDIGKVSDKISAFSNDLRAQTRSLSDVKQQLHKVAADNVGMQTAIGTVRQAGEDQAAKLSEGIDELGKALSSANAEQSQKADVRLNSIQDQLSASERAISSMEPRLINELGLTANKLMVAIQSDLKVEREIEREKTSKSIDDLRAEVLRSEQDLKAFRTALSEMHKDTLEQLAGLRRAVEALQKPPASDAGQH